MALRLSIDSARFLRLGLAIALLALPACKGKSDASAGPLTLADIEEGDAAKASGRRLMALPLGLHRLDTVSPDPAAAVIAVHGYDSEGYEWTHPLKTIGDGSTRVYFYRWDFGQCPEPMAKGLDAAIDQLLQAEPGITSLRILAHSYGGVISGLVASEYDGRAPLLVDLVASPLAGVSSMPRRCTYDGAKAPPADAPVTLRQWRTRQELDNAFRDMDPNPQIVDLPGEVTELPETYQGHRLGHNWSISWVVDHLAGGAAP
ncbi:MAG: alpha/beta hydrolase [Myxococcales bacterium]|nr:alpha/beta hydrolase [Myxococcales bacterium]